MNVKKLVCNIISLSLLVNCGIAALPVSASAVDTDYVDLCISRR